MSESTVNPKKRSWLKWLGLGAGVLVVLGIAGFFLATSHWFVKTVVLPQVKSAIGSDVTIGDSSISPFSQVTLRNVVVTPPGGPALAVIDEVKLRYKLGAIIGGRIAVDEVTVTGPKVTVVENADGSGNLKSFLDAMAKAAKTSKPSSPKSSKPTILDIHNVSIKGGSVRYAKASGKTDRLEAEISGLEISLDSLRNNQAAKLALSALIKISQQTAGTNGFTATLPLSGNVDITLNDQLMPQLVKGGIKISATEATGTLADAKGVEAGLNLDLQGNDFKDVSVRIARGADLLGQARINGQLDFNTLAGKLNIALGPLDKKVLNLAAAGMGYDLGNTQISATNVVEIAPKLASIAVTGGLSVKQLSLRSKTLETPVLDAEVNYQLAVNLDGKSAQVQRFVVSVTRQQQPLVSGNLDQPMQISWGGATQTVPDSTFSLNVTHFDLAPWKAILGTNLPAGQIEAALTVRSLNAGKNLKVGAKVAVNGLAVSSGTTRVENLDIQTTASATLNDLHSLNLESAEVQVNHNKFPLTSIKAQGTVDTKTMDVDIKATVDTDLAQASRLVPVEGVAIREGQLAVQTAIKMQGGATNLTAQISFSKLNGSVKGTAIQGLEGQIDFVGGAQAGLATIRGLNGAFKHAGVSAGRFEVKGTYDLKKQVAALTYSVSDINEGLLAPLAATALAPRKLEKISIQARGELAYDPAADTKVTSSVQLAKLVLTTPGETVKPAPLDISVELEAGMRGQKSNLKKFELSWTPTARAVNRLSAEGTFDLATNGAAPSKLSVKSDSLDVTPLYEMFTGKSAEAKKPEPVQEQKPVVVESEPPAMNLPIQQMDVDVRLAKVFLGEVAITNFVTVVQIRNNVIDVKPMQMQLNGAPVDAAVHLNVGKPGYEYSLAYSMSLVPIKPLANTFSPTYKDQASGLMNSRISLSGAGITGAGIKQNLNGSIYFGLTNSSIQIVGPKITSILSPIAFVLGIQDVLKSPLKNVESTILIGKGEATIKQMYVKSDAFQAEVGGTVGIMAVLTNSTLNLPVNLALSTNVAEKFMASGLVKEGRYARLPNFVKIGGTVGDPKSHTDGVVVAGLLASGTAGRIGGTVGGVLKGVGGIFTGRVPEEAPKPAVPPATVNTNAVTAPATNKPAKSSPLDFLQRLVPPKK